MLRKFAKYLIVLSLLFFSGFSNSFANSEKIVKLSFEKAKSHSFELKSIENTSNQTYFQNNSSGSTSQKSFKLFFDDQDEEETDEESSKKNKVENYFSAFYNLVERNSIISFRSSLAYDRELTDKTFTKQYLLFQVFRI
ncbi:MAG: hypothetical protein V4622_12060 [Bacteroidota bacterium]